MARVSSKNKIVKSIPSSDNGSKVTCYTKSDYSGNKYIVSQNPLKMQFTLWRCIEDGYEKISSSNSPLEFDEIIPYEKEK